MESALQALGLRRYHLGSVSKNYVAKDDKAGPAQIWMALEFDTDWALGWCSVEQLVRVGEGCRYWGRWPHHEWILEIIEEANSLRGQKKSRCFCNAWIGPLSTLTFSCKDFWCNLCVLICMIWKYTQLAKTKSKFFEEKSLLLYLQNLGWKLCL